MLDIVVVGGGAAGMMAAIIAKRQGHNVALLERNDRLGKKLLATGNGRCNYTNRNLSIDNYHGENEMFPISVLSQFNVDMTMDFFESLGITPAIDPGGKVFPNSYQSLSMLEVLRMELDRLKVDIDLESYVSEIEKTGESFRVTTNKGLYMADRLILTTGGLALPDSGSDGTGYDLAKALGHRITKIDPALVQLKLEGKIFKPLSGVKFKGQVSLFIDGDFEGSDQGDILFTDYGISGPPILQLSRKAILALREDRDVRISIKTLYNSEEVDVLAYLYYRFEFMGEKTVSQGLVGLINSKLIEPIVREAKINKNKKLGELKSEEIERLSRVLVDWQFKVVGNQPFKFAQATSGGVDTRDVSNTSLESKIVEGLYFAGEVLDVDGDCGGYNLQWAWSSAYVAGLNASK